VTDGTHDVAGGATPGDAQQHNIPRRIFFGGPLEMNFQLPKSMSVEAKCSALRVRHKAVLQFPCCSRENMAMTTFNLAPLYRSTVGYDRLFDMLGNSIRPDWPPYDILKKGENEYCISMVVAGFSPEEIELTQDGTSLVIAGCKKADESPQQLLHKGITSRNFKQTFSLAAHVKVMDATLENGLLLIDLVREMPEALKPRQIKIETGSGKTAQKLDPQQIHQGVKEPQRDAA